MAGYQFFPSNQIQPGDLNDAFHFVYKQQTGNFDFTARLTGATSSMGTQDGFVGLMLRERIAGAIAANTRHSFVFRLGPSVDQRCWGRKRAWNSDPTHHSDAISADVGSTPYLRMVRYGDQVILYCRASPAVEWTRIDSTTLNGFGVTQTLDVGIAVTSRYHPGTVTATFDNVSVGPLTLPHITSWIGNSLPGGRTHIPQDVSTIYVDGSGNIYTNTIWDEGGAEAVVFDSNGIFVRALEWTHGYPHGGRAVITAGSYIYVAMELSFIEQPGGCSTADTATCPSPVGIALLGGGFCQAAQSAEPCCCDDPTLPLYGETWYVVQRYNMNGTPAPFPGGVGISRSMRLISKTGPVLGLAFAQNRLYVSDSGSQCIRVYDTNLQPFSSDPLACLAPNFPVARPRAMVAVGGLNPSLWIIQAADQTETAKVSRYDINGELTDQIQTVTTPTAVARHPGTGHIWVADDGPDQQIKIFNNSAVQVGTFGDQFGIYSGVKGQVQPKKFNGIVGIGFDTQQNVYVACDGPDLKGNGPAGSNEQGTGTELRKFSPSGNLIWQKFGLEWVDTADADPATNGADLFTKETHYTMNYALPPGQQWTYAGMTIDRFSYGHDGRLHEKRTQYTGAIVRRLNGQRFMFTTTQYGDFLGIYRFNPGSEIAIPAGLLMKRNAWGDSPTQWPFNLPCTCGGGDCPDPPPGSPVDCTDRYIWRDANGNGLMEQGEYELDGPEQEKTYNWSVDDNGDIWTAALVDSPALRRYKFKGLDTHGNPIYHGVNTPPECPDAPCVVSYTTPPEFGNPGAACNEGQQVDPITNPCTGLVRAYYVPSTDTMYLSGYTEQNRAEPVHQFPFTSSLGTEIIRYNNWDGVHGARTEAWRISDVPYQRTPPYTRIASSMDVAGSGLFLAIMDVSEVRLYNTSNGTLSQTFRPGPEVAAESGWIYTPAGINAFQRSSGEFLVFAEEIVGAKNLFYRTTPTSCGPCTQFYCTGTGVGCQHNSTCGPSGCCNYQCGVSLPQCLDVTECPDEACSC